MLRTLALLAGLCLCALEPANASAGGIRSVTLKAAFTPEHLGAGTTVHLGFQVSTSDGLSPSPLIEIQVSYPNELGIASSDLGLENCTEARLQARGLQGCPGNSLMGFGSATVDVPLSSTLVLEKAQITLFSGPVQEGHLGLLFFASGEYPILAELVFPGLIMSAEAPFGGMLDAKLPLIPSVPEGPDAAVISLDTTLGSSKLLYHERVKGKMIAFHPKGILLPPTCPPGGFPFTTRLSFQDGTQGAASTTVPCPRDPAGSAHARGGRRH